MDEHIKKSGYPVIGVHTLKSVAWQAANEVSTLFFLNHNLIVPDNI